MALTDRVVNFVVKIAGDTKDLARDLNKVEGEAKQATGRIQTGLGRVGTFIGQNWQAGAAAAGTAVAAFAAQAIGDFQRTAAEARQTAASTGLSVEEASKYLATLRKMGVDASGGDLADVVNNINQNADAVKALGITATDSAGRVSGLIDYIGGISDETERAKLASKFFGEEGARQFGVLIDSSGRYKDIMDGLSDGEFINEDEARKAAEFDATMKQLSATVKDVSQAVGEELVGALNDLNSVVGPLAGDDGLTKIATGLFKAGVTFSKVITGLDFATRVVDFFGGSVEEAASSFDLFGHVDDVLAGTRTALDEAAKKTDALTVSAEESEEAWGEFLRGQERTPGLYDRIGRAIQDHEKRLDSLIAKSRELAAAARDANAAQAALANFGSAVGVQDALNAFEQARQRWMKENHESVFAGDLGLDPAEESAQAADALTGARDAAMAAVRASMALGKTPSQQAQRGAATLATILEQNPWLRDSLGGLLTTLQMASSSAAPGTSAPVDTPFGVGSKYTSGTTIVLTGGADPYASLSAATDWATRNGAV